MAIDENLAPPAKEGRLFGVAVYPRRGYDSQMLRAELLSEDPAYRIRLLDCPLVDISSTQIRESLLRCEDIKAWLM